MKIQLNSYFQQCLAKHRQIDRKLQPLLDIIKENKINSVHQLSTELSSDDNHIDRHVITTIAQDQPRNTSLRKFISEYNRRSAEKPKSTLEKGRTTPRKKQSKSANQNRNSPRISQDMQVEQPRIYRGPNSKVKKHLVEKMKFQSLEEVEGSHKKITRFKDFIDKVEHKRSSYPRRKPLSLFRVENIRLVDNQEAGEIFRNSPKKYEESQFKVKIRRRFWKCEKATSREKTDLGQVLCVRGMKNMAMTIE